MDSTKTVTQVAAAMASRSRVRMLEALADGVARSAIDLSAIAEVQPNTASTHLRALCNANLIKVKQHGKYRYFQIKDKTVSDLFETMGEQICSEDQQHGAPMSEMAFARTCYDHLAGWLGVRITDYLKQQNHIVEINNSFETTEQGKIFLRSLGVNIENARSAKRMFARSCRDWTENKSHIGGALGAEIYHSFKTQGWIEKNMDYREVFVTNRGKLFFRNSFQINI